MKIDKVKSLKKIRTLLLVVVFMFGFLADVPAQNIRTVSMDFQEASLKDVLKIFSQQAGLNFVATDNIEDRKITLYLDSVTVQDALDSIMKANSLTYEQAKGSSVFIVKESGKAKIDMVTKVYTLQFARISAIAAAAAQQEGGSSQVADMNSILSSLLSKAEDGSPLGGIVLDARTNSVIVTAIPEDMVLIEETIKKLDAITPQALIEAEIVEIRTGALKRLGLEWGDSQGTFVRFSGPTKITHFPFIRQSNPLSKSLLGSITSTTTTATSSAGTDTTSTAASQTPTLATLSLSEFSIVLKALETEGDAKFLAKPRIMVLNNESAEINITADTAIGVTKTSVTDTGEVIEEAERTETGVSLKVTPTINREGYITMTLEPTVSRAVPSAQFVNFADPTKRSITTTVMVRDGQTIAIGGLLKTDEVDDTRAMPGLSRLPFLGNLFKRNTKTNLETELIIFITAHVIQNLSDMSEMKEAADIIEAPVAEKEKQMAQTREAEIRKTVMKLRKKRELSR